MAELDTESPEIIDALDSSELLATGKVHRVGKKLTLAIKKPSKKLLQEIIILRSDVSCVTIPEVEMEEGDGTGRFASLEDILNDMVTKINCSASYFPGIDKFLFSMDQMRNGEKEFTLIIDDPISLSRIYHHYENEINDEYEITSETYTRTWQQNENLGLLDEQESNEFEDEIAVQKLADLILNSSNIVGFTGAGVSVESGVPSYRGSGTESLWTKYDPKSSDYNSFMNDMYIREQHWKMKADLNKLTRSASPNPSHSIFAFLNERDRLTSVITQNIDGLHERAGVPDEKVIHLHGSERIARCLDCKAEYDGDQVHDRIIAENLVIPTCTKCSGHLKPGTICFGEPLDKETVKSAEEALRQCDLLIIMGTSLVVQPASQLPAICLNRSIPVVIINKEGETQYDLYANLVIRRPSGEVMKEVMETLEKSL